MDDSDDEPISSGAFAKFALWKEIPLERCLSCGIEHPSLLVHENAGVSTALVYSKGPAAMPSALEVITVECENCGFLWLYNRRSIAKKLKELDG
jgi:Zn ribbon nucleic-acid-binding protein